MALRIEVAGETNVGMKRTHNEDSFSIIEDAGLYIVADGQPLDTPERLAERCPAHLDAPRELPLAQALAGLDLAR